MKCTTWIYAVFVLVLFAVSALFQASSQAALCVFRNPDKNVYKMFPKATGYRLVLPKVDKELRKKVEKFLGQKLDFDETGEHSFYLILKGEEVIGMIRPHAERGKYGIVEMVWALSLDGKILDYAVQRSRERGTDKVRSEAFRRQFRGKTVKTAFTEKDSKRINGKLFKVPEKAERISSVVAFSAKKNMFLYKLFFPEYNKIPEKGPHESPGEDSEEKGQSK